MGHHLAAEQSGEDAIFFRDMMADGEAGTFLAADHDFVLLDEFADVLKADGRFMQRDVMMLSQGVDEVGGGDRFTDAVFPAASLDEIIEQESDDVIGLKESSVLVYDAEAVGVTIGGDADVGVGF